MKNRMKIHTILKNEGYGAITMLGKELGKSPNNIGVLLRSGKISIQLKFDIVKAMNKIYGKEYTLDDLFR